MPIPERLTALESLQKSAPNMRGAHATMDVLNEEYRVEVSDDGYDFLIDIDMVDSERATGMICTPDGRLIDVEDERLEAFAEYLLKLIHES
jgi:hypothetical protein